MASERLQKFLSRAGVASRRHAEELIEQGRVAVNNVVVRELGTKVSTGDLVTVDGRLVSLPESHTYVVLYKPAGVVTTLEDPQGRPTVAEYVQELGRRVYPIGRLDFDAEGALLMTDDGDLAHALTHPSFQVPRTYLAKVKGTPTEAALQKLKDGVRLEDGPAKAVEAVIYEEAERNTWVRIVVTEGRQHLVKRLCAAIGHPVTKLFRPAHATIPVQGLRPGDMRPLNGAEIERVKMVANGQPVPEPELSLPARRHGHGPAPARGMDMDEAPPRKKTGLKTMAGAAMTGAIAAGAKKFGAKRAPAGGAGGRSFGAREEGGSSRPTRGGFGAKAGGSRSFGAREEGGSSRPTRGGFGAKAGGSRSFGARDEGGSSRPTRGGFGARDEGTGTRRSTGGFGARGGTGAGAESRGPRTGGRTFGHKPRTGSFGAADEGTGTRRTGGGFGSRGGAGAESRGPRTGGRTFGDKPRTGGFGARDEGGGTRRTGGGFGARAGTGEARAPRSFGDKPRTGGRTFGDKPRTGGFGARDEGTSTRRTSGGFGARGGTGEARAPRSFGDKPRTGGFGARGGAGGESRGPRTGGRTFGDKPRSGGFGARSGGAEGGARGAGKQPRSGGKFGKLPGSGGRPGGKPRGPGGRG